MRLSNETQQLQYIIHGNQLEETNRDKQGNKSITSNGLTETWTTQFGLLAFLNQQIEVGYRSEWKCNPLKKSTSIVSTTDLLLLAAPTSPPASYVRNLIFCCSDGSHLRVNTVIHHCFGLPRFLLPDGAVSRIFLPT